MLIGIDVGGTKTKAVVFDEHGRSVKEITLQSAHPMCATDDEIITILKQCMLDDQSPVVIGYAGYGKSEQMKEHISSLVHEALPDRIVVILGDIGGSDNVVKDIQVRQEVLPETLLSMDPRLLHDRPGPGTTTNFW